MIENIKLLVSVIVALMESLPQVTPTGTIPDVEYGTLISGAILGVVSCAGFQVVGFTDAQIRGASDALVSTVRAWQKAPRVAA